MKVRVKEEERSNDDEKTSSKKKDDNEQTVEHDRLEKKIENLSGYGPYVYSTCYKCVRMCENILILIRLFSFSKYQV